MMRVMGVALALALAPLLLAAGCGSDGGSNPSTVRTDEFVGAWTYSGMLQPVCTGLTPDPVDLTGQIMTITKTGPTQLQATLGASCTVNFNVSGGTASAASGQSCSFDVSGVPASVSFTSWTLTLTTATSISSSVSGTAFGICTISGAGTLTK